MNPHSPLKFRMNRDSSRRQQKPAGTKKREMINVASNMTVDFAHFRHVKEDQKIMLNFQNLKTKI